MVSLADGGLVLPSRPGHGFMRLRKTFRSAPRKSFPSAMNETVPRPTGVCCLAHLLGSSSPRKVGKEDALNFYSDCWGAARSGMEVVAVGLEYLSALPIWLVLH